MTHELSRHQKGPASPPPLWSDPVADDYNYCPSQGV